jgi:hypothetical protein
MCVSDNFLAVGRHQFNNRLISEFFKIHAARVTERSLDLSNILVEFWL